jgi:hypothetical protein
MLDGFLQIASPVCSMTSGKPWDGIIIVYDTKADDVEAAIDAAE